MLPAWQFILVWDTATSLFVFEIHQTNQKIAPRRGLKYRHEVQFSPKTWFSIMFSIYVLKSLCFFFYMFRHTGFTESYEWSRKWDQKKPRFWFSRFRSKIPWEKNAKYIGKVQWLFVVMFSTYFLPKQMNQNRQCKNVHEVQFIPKTCFPMMFSIYVLKSLCFFLICFATPVLQNNMNQ